MNWYERLREKHPEYVQDSEEAEVGEMLDASRIDRCSCCAFKDSMSEDDGSFWSVCVCEKGLFDGRYDSYNNLNQGCCSYHPDKCVFFRSRIDGADAELIGRIGDDVYARVCTPSIWGDGTDRIIYRFSADVMDRLLRTGRAEE